MVLMKKFVTSNPLWRSLLIINGFIFVRLSGHRNQNHHYFVVCASTSRQLWQTAALDNPLPPAMRLVMQACSNWRKLASGVAAPEVPTLPPGFQAPRVFAPESMFTGSCFKVVVLHLCHELFRSRMHQISNICSPKKLSFKCWRNLDGCITS